MSDPVLGIDLGTSNSVVTVVLEGDPIVVPDERGNKIHPSLVHFGEDGDVDVGAASKRFERDDPLHTVFSAKRLIGQSFEQESVQQFREVCPVRIEATDEGRPVFVVHGQQHTPVEISTIVLEYLKDVASRYLGTQVEQAIITVPAHFNESQRRATKTSAEHAGLEVLRLINEPTAAALAYGYGQGKRERVAVYDFGGGTFDITLLELRDQVFEVLATAGESYLGGDDFDYQLVETMVQAFEQQYGHDLRGNENAWYRLKMIARDIKHTLTKQDEVTVEVTEYVPGSLAELDLEFTFSREILEQRCEQITDQTLDICRDALSVADVQPAQIDHLVMVGGSTRVPLVQKKVGQFFNRKPSFEIDPDKVVSIGAALFGASLQQSKQLPPGQQDDDNADGPLLIDVTPHALGVATVGGVMDIIIERNGSLPLRRSRRFSPSKDNQTRIVLPVYAGNSRRIEDNQKLGLLALNDLEPRPREQVEIEVTFAVDTDGMIQVDAEDVQTGRKESVELSIGGDESDLDDYDESEMAQAQTQTGGGNEQ